jgi:hypothetical protein
MNAMTSIRVHAVAVGCALPLLLPVASPSRLAAQVPCAGGTLAINAASDTPVTLPTFNVGQQAILTAVTTGFTASSFAWTIPGPHIKDYQEELGTRSSPQPVTPDPWSTTALTAADLAGQTVRLYWKPSAAQTHPQTGGPEPRAVSLAVTPSGGGSCTVTATYMIERNLTDPDRQPEDFYTSTHRAPTTTNPLMGRIIDEHMYWHQIVKGGPAGTWIQFLPWHGYFLRRFNEWRAEFGYPPVAPWYPGRPLPTGPAYDHTAGLRLATYDPAANRIPTYYTIAGGTAINSGHRRLGEYASVDEFSNSFEPFYHGNVHCNIGSATGGFFDTSGPGFGSMCKSSSPKDPMFWRWHGFIDVMYRNYCRLSSQPCFGPAEPPADPWMADNAADVASGGTVPSSGALWMSPDVWNRRTEVTDPACVPTGPAGELQTVGGLVRQCGSSADHENPVTGSTNFLYGTIRNTRPGAARTVYAETAVYIANAATGLAWPADFTLLPESRQFLTLFLEPGQESDIGPIPWTPPSPSPSDHWCLYLRVLTVQETPPVEGADVGTNVAQSNSIAWRNLKIVPPGGLARSRFIVRNIRERPERIGLEFEVAPELIQNGRVLVRLGPELRRAFRAADRRLEGGRALGDSAVMLVEPKARIEGLPLRPREGGAVELLLQPRRGAAAEGDIVVSQHSSQGVDGGTVLRVGGRGARDSLYQKKAR